MLNPRMNFENRTGKLANVPYFAPNVMAATQMLNLIHFIRADSQYNSIFISSSPIWNLGKHFWKQNEECSTSIFEKIMIFVMKEYGQSVLFKYTYLSKGP